MCTNKKITVFGGVAIDSIGTITNTTNDLNNRGKVEKYVGGKALNNAIALAVNYKNDNVSLLSAAENNYHLPAIRQELKTSGVNDLVMAADEPTTNLFMAISQPNGESITLTEEKLFNFDIPTERIDESLDDIDALLVTGEVSPENFKYSIQKASTAKAKIFVLACSDTEAERLCFENLKVDFLLGSSSNIDIIAKRHNKKDIFELSECLNACVIVFENKDNNITINYFKVFKGLEISNSITIKETNAIGYQDLFCASFIESTLEGLSEQEAIQQGALEISRIKSNRAIETAQIKTEINKSLRNANIDALTNVLNRHGFEQELATVLKRNKQIFIAMLDIDHFKSINDKYGHQVGDDVLSIFAKRISSSLKESTSTFARWGGEEFCLVLECSENDVENILNRILTKISSRKFYVEDKNHKIAVTVSIGYSEILDKSKFKEYQEQADAALYMAKSNGRNQVVKFTP